MGIEARAGAAASRQPASISQFTTAFDPLSATHAGRAPRAGESFPELDCVRSSLAAGQIDAAESKAARLGVGADRVLIASGTLAEETYLRALAASLGVAFEPLDSVPRAACPVSDERLVQSAAMGLVPLTVDDELCVAVAPRGIAARQIVEMIGANPALAPRFRFTTAERLTRFVLRYAGTALSARAAGQLKSNWPMLSAAPPRWRKNRIAVSCAALLTLATAVLAPAVTLFAVELFLATVFLAWLALRLSTIFAVRQATSPGPKTTDDALPVYSVIAALYNEARSVDGLLRAIERLDYPGIR